MIPATKTMDGVCASCGCPFDDWTPRCRSCRERMRSRARRSGDTALLGMYHAACRTNQAVARRLQTIEGRDAATGGWLPRGPRGRWMKVTA